MKFFLIIFILLLSACSYKHDSLYVGVKKTSEQGVANTKKTQILKNGKVRIFITVTYLNSLKNQKFIDKAKEQFVIGFHFVNLSDKETKKDLTKDNLYFNIEDNTHLISVKKLKPNSQILNFIPASNPWSQYFLVQTDKIDKNNITFNFKVNSYEKKSLTFEKDY